MAQVTDALAVFVVLSPIIGYPIYKIYKIISSKKKQTDQLDSLKKSGFQVDHLMNGSVAVAFNDEAKKIAFVYSDMVAQYDHGDIMRWSLHAYTAGPNTLNAIHFTLRDKNRPLIKSEGLSPSEGTYWMAKLEAILNG